MRKLGLTIGKILPLGLGIDLGEITYFQPFAARVKMLLILMTSSHLILQPVIFKELYLFSGTACTVQVKHVY